MSLQQQLRAEHISRRADWCAQAQPDPGIDLKRVHPRYKVRKTAPSASTLHFVPLRTPRQRITIRSHGTSVTVPVVDLEAPLPVSKELITRRVALHFGVGYFELRKPGRYHYIVRPRWVACYLMTHVLGSGRSAIARYFKQDHATVLYGIRKIERLMLTDADLCHSVVTIARGLRE